MGFWPDVKKGDKVQHNALLENNVRHLLNSLNGFGDGFRRGGSNGVVRIQIWNASGEPIAAGQPVAFDNTKSLCGDSVPAIKVTDPVKPWGVCVQSLAANSIGDCIVAGPAVVSLSGGDGDYAAPVVNGTGFTRSETGSARVLYAGSDGKGIILLGGAGNIGGGVSGYQGYFTIEDASEEGEGGVIAPKVKVWDPRTPESQSQPCYVNGYRFNMSNWTSEAISASCYILLTFKVTSSVYQPHQVVFETKTTVPDDTDTEVHYQLGHIEISSGKMTIYQDHVCGVARMLWISHC